MSHQQASSTIKSIWQAEVQSVLDKAREQAGQRKMNPENRGKKRVQVDERDVDIDSPFPSPEDWRDLWIYFIMVDRFNNPTQYPNHRWNPKTVEDIAGPGKTLEEFVAEGGTFFQGGTLEGVRQQLGYLQELGVGAIWLTPVLKNCQYKSTYHGYGIQDFLNIDPRFVTNQDDPEQELINLIDEAHARGMYVIFDVVLNHTGNVFSYVKADQIVPSIEHDQFLPDQPYPIRWHDQDGNPHPEWSEAPENPHDNAAVWPQELCKNQFFRRKGTIKGDTGNGGDFTDLREIATDGMRGNFQEGDPGKQQTAEELRREIHNVLIRIHQYLIAKFDIDGFRIDTLRFIEPDFARTFGNAMREFAISIGKKNFFTFGEIWIDEPVIEETITRYVGHNGDLTGIDSVLDFPLFFKLPKVLKGFLPCTAIRDVYVRRREIQQSQGLFGARGDISQFFVTFLDNHDVAERFYYSSPDHPHQYDKQVTLGIACLFALRGIPCLYYGTEQGLNGSTDPNQPHKDLVVRQALWGKPDQHHRCDRHQAFNRDHQFYQAIRQLTLIRKQYPALCQGRQYFRAVSGNQIDFAMSQTSPGLLAFSRILNDEEVVIIANTNPETTEEGNPLSISVIVDANLNPEKTEFGLVYSNTPREPWDCQLKVETVEDARVNGSVKPVSIITVQLEPMEVQIWASRKLQEIRKRV